jgi:hypothetical protein
MVWTPKIVGAIDLGTHGSGYALAVVSPLNDDPMNRKVVFYTRYSGARADYPKNLTAILVAEDGHVMAWGHKARTLWAEASDQGNPDRLGYAYAFKMALKEGDSNPDMPTVGGTLSLADPGEVRHLVSSYLSEVRKVALAEITAMGYTEGELRWCITVPAIWDDEDKQAMRQAAYDAGFPEGEDRLLLSIEPEAAALYCQVRMVELADGSGRKEKLNIDIDGSRFMVVDAGGGTVDITAYESSSGDDQRITLTNLPAIGEIGVATGGRLGSEYINHAFRSRILADRFGPESIRRLEQEDSADLLKLSDEWETAKTTAEVEHDPDGTARFIDKVTIDVPAAVWDVLDEGARARLTETAGGKPYRLVLQPAEVEALFTTVTDGIVDKVEEQLANMRKTSGAAADGGETIVLVGGLAMSTYLRQVLRQRFGDEHRILVPPNPALAVLEGAVHYAYNPEAFASRRSKYTYGFAMARPWESGVDDPRRKFNDSRGDMMCRGRFAIAVQRMQRVVIDEPFAFSLEPAVASAEKVTVQLYRTRASDPRYVDEAGCEPVAELVIDISETVHLDKRPIDLLLFFGRSQISGEASDRTTKRKFKVTADFDQML